MIAREGYLGPIYRKGRFSMTEYEKMAQEPLDDQDSQRSSFAVRIRPEEINDRFYRDLEFGTGGPSGVIGAGTNRMNVYTVR